MSFEMIEDLIEAGLIEQVLISQDRGWYNAGEPRGGEKRPYEKLLTEFVPAMKKAGIDEATVGKLLKENPQRALTPGVRGV